MQHKFVSLKMMKNKKKMGEKKQDMAMPQTVWFSLKKSLHCKWEASDVQNPKSRKQLLSRKASGCSRSMRDVIHGSKRQPTIAAAASCSPRSIGSTEFLNPIAHEVILSNSTCELKITGGFNKASYFNPSFSNSATLTPPTNTFPQRHAIISHKRSSVCHKCGDQFAEWDALESHHLSNHAVSELLEGDSSRKIVEIICGSSWLKSESRIERILKVHNMQKRVAGFEEYRETVKINASKLRKKHPRCLADGNELLRFYGTTLTCSLTTICVSEKCCVCRIIRHGFSAAKDGVGVFTTSTSGRAIECIEMDSDDSVVVMRKALIVCRVVAGRVHRPLDNIHEIVAQTGFDSLAGKVGVCSNIEELYLLNPKALLPCFVVICKT